MQLKTAIKYINQPKPAKITDSVSQKESCSGHFFRDFSMEGTGGPLLMRICETLEKQPCKQRSDLVLNGQMRVSK